ncbi:MAG: copper homeostasis protein CutC [Nocardioides sp.]
MAAPALLEVAVHHAQDVAGAQEGGADRLALIAPGETAGLSPDLAAASAVLRATDLPVRVMLRLNDGYTTTGGEFTRLVGLAEEYVGLGAEGVVFGFLDSDLEVDVETCAALAQALPGVPWTFHRAIDATLDLRRSWRRVRSLPGLTAVRSGGSPQGLSHGYDDLLDLATGDADIARLLMPSGGLLAEQVPWFRRTGVSQFHVGVQVRPGATYKSYVDADFVRSWRRLLDPPSGTAGTVGTVGPAGTAGA